MAGQRTKRLLTARRRDVASLALRRQLARAQRGARMVPDYLVIGAKRSGSTSLQKYLTAHPDVLRPYITKGTRYFDVQHERGWRWFLSHFPPERAARRRHRQTGFRPLTGEASPYYVFHPLAPERIAQELPEARLLLLLRDPVLRAWSQYRYELDRGFESLGIHEALDREEERLADEEDRMRLDHGYRSHAHRHFSYLARGRYAEQLERLYQHVPPDRVLVRTSEELFANPAAVLAQMYDFLGLRPFRPTNMHPHKANHYEPVPDDVVDRLVRYFQPHNARLVAMLGSDSACSGIGRWIVSESPQPRPGGDKDRKGGCLQQTIDTRFSVFRQPE